MNDLNDKSGTPQASGEPAAAAAATGMPSPVERRDAFISYSHGASGEMARGLQNALQRFAKPWWRRRSISVFRDETDLSVNPALWDFIVANLAASDRLILIASPQAANSKWVKREVRYWLGDHDVERKSLEELDQPLEKPDRERIDRLIFVLASGAVVWRDGPDADFDWASTTALPRCLAGVFAKEPLWVDLSDVVEAGGKQVDLDRRNPQFTAAAARIYSRIKNIDLATLIGQDAREHRRTMRTAWFAATTLGVLAVAAAVAAWLALLAAAAADKQRQIAEADRQAALAQYLVARSPEKLPEAGAIAANAYSNMVRLSASTTAPAWLLRLIDATGLSGFGMLSQIVGADQYRATFDRVQPAVDVMRTVEQLLPALRTRPSSPRSVNSYRLAFLDDGSLVSQSAENAVEIWPAGSEQSRAVLLDQPAYRINGRANTAFSANGRIVASEAASDGIVRLRNAISGEVLQTIDPRSVFREPELSPPQRNTAPGGGGLMSETFVAGGRSGGALLGGLAISADGQNTFLITRGGRARLYSTTGKGAAAQTTYAVNAPELRGFERLSQVVLDPGGQTVALSSSSNLVGRVPVAVLRAADGTPLFAPLIHGSGVDAIAFSRDGKRLATGTDDGGVFVWDAQTGAGQRAFNVGVAVRSLAFGTGDLQHLLLVGTGEGLAKGYDLTTGREIVRAPHPGRVDALAWDERGQRFATGAVSIGTQKVDPIRIWAVADLPAIGTSRMTSSSWVERIAVWAAALRRSSTLGHCSSGTRRRAS